LLSFFVNENHYITVNKNKGEIFKYAIASSKMNSILNFLGGNLFASRHPTSNARESISRLKSSKKYCFKGNIFVVTNGFTVSTASNTAALFQYKTTATIIGVETGGGENNLNAYFFVTVKLPYSKIKIQIPQYRIDLNLTENKGSGVIPNVTINYRIKDIISKRDLEMEQIIQMVSEKQKP
jgi:C-terminal processing protease CtpA/Prc